jgi:hypothetical protein
VLLKMLKVGFFLVLVSPILALANSTSLLAELTASDGHTGDGMGISAAVCGDTVAVGASELNSSTFGAVYVFVKGSLGWANMTQTAKLTASDGVQGAVFGSSVACFGKTVVVGAPHQNGGEAYVFVEPSDGWSNMTETARLTSPDNGGTDDFGYSVAIKGQTIAVGAPQASGPVGWQGKAYIFERPKGGWKTTSACTAELTASNAQFDDGLGASVSMSADKVVAGAPNGGGAGAAYVFVKPATGWATTTNFAAELTASDGVDGEAFGYSVSIFDNTVASGAYQTNAAYIFVEPANGWATETETAKVTAVNPGSNFAYSLSLGSNKLVVGSANDPTDSAVFEYIRSRAGWETTSKYNARLTSSDGSGFGFSVAVGGGVIVAGSIEGNDLRGAAYIFGP